MVKERKTPEAGTLNRFKLKEKLTNEEVESLTEFYKQIYELCSIEPDFFQTERRALENLTFLKKHYGY